MACVDLTFDMNRCKRNTWKYRERERDRKQVKGQNDLALAQNTGCGNVFPTCMCLIMRYYDIVLWDAPVFIIYIKLDFLWQVQARNSLHIQTYAHL